MRYVNEWDIDTIVREARHRDLPNQLKAAATLDRLQVWVDANSDGWAYWAAPVKAAAKLIAQLEVRTPGLTRWDEVVSDDISDAELRSALTPIKSFFTRQGLPAAVRTEILEGVR